MRGLSVFKLNFELREPAKFIRSNYHNNLSRSPEILLNLYANIFNSTKSKLWTLNFKSICLKIFGKFLVWCTVIPCSYSERWQISRSRFPCPKTDTILEPKFLVSSIHLSKTRDNVGTKIFGFIDPSFQNGTYCKAPSSFSVCPKSLSRKILPILVI